MKLPRWIRARTGRSADGDSTAPAVMSVDELMVNEKFWLGKGREMVEAAVTKREAAAERLTTALAWFWTVYSAATVVGVAVAVDRPRLVTVLMAAPVISLIFAYVTSMTVLIPVTVTFDPRAPNDVEEAYWQAVEYKRNRLHWAYRLLIASAVFIAAGLAVSAILTARSDNFSLSARVTQGSSGAEMVITGTMPPGALVLVTASVEGTPSHPVRRLVSVPKSGQLDTTLEVPNANRYLVSANWSERDLTRTLERHVTSS